MPAHDLDLILGATLEAGDLARRFWRAEPKAWDKGGDAGPVSEADLAVDAHLHHVLRRARPDYGWLSEETQDNPDRLHAERVFIVDPIDGTRSFLAGERTWAVSVAVAEAGQITAAVVHLPLREKTYTASLKGGATLNGSPLLASQRGDPDGASILAARPTMNAEHWSKPLNLQRSFRTSLAYRLSLVGEGRYDAMLMLRRTWEWDIAAGDLIAREAGALTSDRHGNALRFNTPEASLPGILAAGSGVHGAIQSALSG